jgi:hypothetical protein
MCSNSLNIHYINVLSFLNCVDIVEGDGNPVRNVGKYL